MENIYPLTTQKGKIMNVLINHIGQWVSVHDISINIKPKILNHTARIEEIRKNLPQGYKILNYTRRNKIDGQKYSRYCLTDQDDMVDRISSLSDFLLFQKNKWSLFGL